MEPVHDQLHSSVPFSEGAERQGRRLCQVVGPHVYLVRSPALFRQFAALVHHPILKDGRLGGCLLSRPTDFAVGARRLFETAPVGLKLLDAGAQPAVRVANASRQRDPRVPAPGTQLIKRYKKDTIAATVLEDGYQYGERSTNRLAPSLAK
jgi:hypothetical protein